LLHQFLAGLPVSVSKQLRATDDVNKVDTALERARLLMALEAEGEEKPSSGRGDHNFGGRTTGAVTSRTGQGAHYPSSCLDTTQQINTTTIEHAALLLL